MFELVEAIFDLIRAGFPVVVAVVLALVTAMYYVEKSVE